MLGRPMHLVHWAFGRTAPLALCVCVCGQAKCKSKRVFMPDTSSHQTSDGHSLHPQLSCNWNGFAEEAPPAILPSHSDRDPWHGPHANLHNKICASHASQINNQVATSSCCLFGKLWSVWGLRYTGRQHTGCDSIGTSTATASIIMLPMAVPF